MQLIDLAIATIVVGPVTGVHFLLVLLLHVVGTVP
jgi:hypothetical protein